MRVVSGSFGSRLVAVLVVGLMVGVVSGGVPTAAGSDPVDTLFDPTSLMVWSDESQDPPENLAVSKSPPDTDFLISVASNTLWLPGA